LSHIWPKAPFGLLCSEMLERLASSFGFLFWAVRLANLIEPDDLIVSSVIRLAADEVELGNDDPQFKSKD
jgi:hypothetical protein